MDEDDVMSEILEYISSHPFTSNKTLMELLLYNGINCWWLMDIGVYTLSSQETNRFTSIHDIYERTYMYLVPYYEFLLKLFTKSLWIVCSKKRFGSHKKSNVRTIIFVEKIIEWRHQINVNNEKSFHNIYHQSTISRIKGCNKIIAPFNLGYIPTISTLKKYIKILKNSRELREIPCATWDFWSFKSWETKKNATRHFITLWHLIEYEDEWFNGLARILSSNVRVVKEYFRKSFTLSIPHAFLEMSIIDNIIHKCQPQIFVMTDEQMVDGRVLTFKGREYGIPTIGIQHGIINHHPAYFNHNSNDVLISEQSSKFAFPIPNITCIWGEIEHNLLTKEAGYPENSVVITGNPRYDYLHLATVNYNRSNFCDKYGINPKSCIVLWTTQCHGWPDAENHAYFTEVFETFKDNSGATLIIKQHPGEPDRYKKLIDEYLKKYQMKSTVIVPNKNADTTEMVFCSDILINKNSTTGQEAIAFHKSMIIMDFSDTPDTGDFVLEGVGLPVYNPGELLPTIQTIINNEINLSDKQDLYIRNHMYKIDGESAKRVADVISKCITCR